MPSFRELTARAAPLRVNDVDTDQIIPARFLKRIDKEGLGELLFADWRYDADRRPRADFPLNRPEYQGAQILLAGANFGCGSSREHAPWALVDYGFRAIVSTSFADIFRSNSLKNGLLPVTVDPETQAALFALVEAEPQSRISIDLATQTLTAPGRPPVRFPIDPFAKKCLLEGIDELGYLQSFATRIAEHEARTEVTQ
jgi:3-isopropylmalate/(R)-2-methylmalate dehydratase small subunit